MFTLQYTEKKFPQFRLMNRIITITLNPALDKSITVQKLVPEKKLKAENIKTEPGGGGVNVSRALHKLGLETEAFYLAGGYTGREFTMLLEKEGVKAVPIDIKGDTRENFIVLDRDSGKQYRFGMEGPVVKESEWMQVLERINGETDLQYIVASGSLAPGIPADFFKQLAILAKQKKARLVVDTSGTALAEAVKQGVFLIKPNLGELASIYGSKADLGFEDAVQAATGLIEKHGCEMIAVSMGADGALLVTRNGYCHNKAPKVTVLSTVGAGDSMLAGLIYGLVNGYTESDMLAYGVATGTAATLNPGTELCSKADTERLFMSIQGDIK
jgi:6-phosphofructokinase 2